MQMLVNWKPTEEFYLSIFWLYNCIEWSRLEDVDVAADAIATKMWKIPHTHTLSVDGYLRDIIGMHALAEISANKPYYAGIHLSILNTDVWQK